MDGHHPQGTVRRPHQFPRPFRFREKQKIPRPARAGLSDVGDSPRIYLEKLSKQRTSYPGFNLLVGTPWELWHYSNQNDKISPVEPGIHGLSNALLDTPWPKVVKGRERLTACLRNPDPSLLFELLADEEPAPDEQLPDTGVGLEMERLLSPAFIRMPGYGTRSSSVLIIRAKGDVTFIERTFSREGTREVCHRFSIEAE